MNSENDNICIICLAELTANPSIKLNCNHCFHIDCITLWQIKKNLCPICRKPIQIKEKKHKSKSCITPLELIVGIIFIIVFTIIFIIMILKSVEKLKLKKKGKLINRPNKKYEDYFGFNLFFDLISAKKENKLKILKEYAKKTPLMIKYKIEKFFDDIVEGYDDFIESIHEFNKLRNHWNDK